MNMNLFFLNDDQGHYLGYVNLNDTPRAGDIIETEERTYVLLNIVWQDAAIIESDPNLGRDPLATLIVE